MQDIIGQIYNNWTYYQTTDFVIPSDLLPYNVNSNSEPSILWSESIKQHNFENRPSNYFIEDGSYLRLKNFTLGYSIPESVLNFANISRLRLYFTSQNLLTFTKYKGFDPEVSEYGIDMMKYPQSRTFMFGANINF